MELALLEGFGTDRLASRTLGDDQRPPNDRLIALTNAPGIQPSSIKLLPTNAPGSIEEPKLLVAANFTRKYPAYGHDVAAGAQAHVTDEHLGRSTLPDLRRLM